MKNLGECRQQQSLLAQLLWDKKPGFRAHACKRVKFRFKCLFRLGGVSLSVTRVKSENINLSRSQLEITSQDKVGVKRHP